MEGYKMNKNLLLIISFLLSTNSFIKATDSDYDDGVPESKSIMPTTCQEVTGPTTEEPHQDQASDSADETKARSVDGQKDESETSDSDEPEWMSVDGEIEFAPRQILYPANTLQGLPNCPLLHTLSFLPEVDLIKSQHTCKAIDQLGDSIRKKRYRKLSQEEKDQALFEAAMGGQLRQSQLLLDCNGNIETQDNSFGRPALICASRNGQLDIVQLLLDLGANIDIKDKQSGRTALMWASRNGHMDIVQLLLDHGANINIQDILVYTAAIGASIMNNREIIQILHQEIERRQMAQEDK